MISAGNSVDPATLVRLLQCHVEPEPLLQRAGEGATNRVRPRAGRGDDLGDGGTFRPSEHGNQRRLVRPLARLAPVAALCESLSGLPLPPPSWTRPKLLSLCGPLRAAAGL